jgi:dCTP deaminase
MILSDKGIEHAINTDRIGCEPQPTEEQIQPASLDVRLSNEVYHFDEDKTVKSFQHRLQPGKRYLGDTEEVIDLPNDIAASIAGRSTIGRMGVIVHKTAGWVDPGFTGSLTLELMNLGNKPVDLEAGMRVAQLVFFQLYQPSSGYDGSYQGQTTPTKAQQ